MIERYLIVAALALLVFAAVGVGGLTMLRPGRLRTGWMVASALLRARRASSSPPRASTSRSFDNELQFRGDAHASLVACCDEPAVEARAALRAADAAQPQARARRALGRSTCRATACSRAPTRSGAAAAARRRAVRHEPLRDLQATPSPTPSTRPRSSSRRAAGGAIATSDYVAAYARC